MKSYVVATIKPWNVAAFHRRAAALPGRWYLQEGPDGLTVEALRKLNPRYIFFPHWSWIVPRAVLDEFECVCFHMTDVPYGRGGSPLQNLIVRGHLETRVTALRMVEQLDAGPVYLKRPLSLAGRAVDIFERLADLVYDMAAEIVATEPVPAPQSGPEVAFRRRHPEDSALPPNASPEALYDFIRMLDAPTYPAAFLRWGNYRLEFHDAALAHGRLEARVIIHEEKEP